MPDEAGRDADESDAAGGRSPVAVRSRTIQSGTEAISSEASPIGTSRSATKSSAFAPSRSTPTSTAEPSASRPTRNGSRAPAEQRRTRPSARPASRKRTPGREERRDRLAGELDPEVRRAPDDVDRPEREPGAARHRFSVSAAPAASRTSPSTRAQCERHLLDPEPAEAGRSPSRAPNWPDDQEGRRRDDADPRPGDRDREDDHDAHERRRAASTSGRRSPSRTPVERCAGRRGGRRASGRRRRRRRTRAPRGCRCGRRAAPASRSAPRRRGPATNANDAANPVEPMAVDATALAAVRMPR